MIFGSLQVRDPISPFALFDTNQSSTRNRNASAVSDKRVRLVPKWHTRHEPWFVSGAGGIFHRISAKDTPIVNEPFHAPIASFVQGLPITRIIQHIHSQKWAFQSSIIARISWTKCDGNFISSHDVLFVGILFNRTKLHRLIVLKAVNCSSNSIDSKNVLLPIRSVCSDLPERSRVRCGNDISNLFVDSGLASHWLMPSKLTFKWPLRRLSFSSKLTHYHHYHQPLHSTRTTPTPTRTMEIKWITNDLPTSWTSWPNLHQPNNARATTTTTAMMSPTV